VQSRSEEEEERVSALAIPEWTTIPQLVPGSVEHRTSHSVSASAVACLFGLHPFLTVGRLAAIKRGEVEDTAGPAAQRGHEWEERLATWWSHEHGLDVYKPGASYRCGPLTANPDRRVEGAPGLLLECKATGDKAGPVKPYWWWQGQAQMACTGATVVILVILWGGSILYEEQAIQRDEGAIARIIEAADAFLAALDLGMDPEPSVLEPEATTVQVGEGEAHLVSQWREAKAMEAASKAEASEARGKLIALLGAPGLAVGSRLQVVDADGKALCRVRVQNGRVPMVPVAGATRGDPVIVIET
jgi:hypothetical protein